MQVSIRKFQVTYRRVAHDQWRGECGNSIGARFRNGLGEKGTAAAFLVPDFYEK